MNKNNLQGKAGAPEPLERVRKGCSRIAFVARLMAVFALLTTVLAVLCAWECVGRAYDAGAPSLHAALYIGTDGGAVGSGDLVSVSFSSSGYDDTGTWMESREGATAIQSLAVGLPQALCELACALYVARLFEWVAQSGRPFSDRVVHGLRMTARLLLVVGVLPAVTCHLAFALRPDVFSSFAFTGGSTAFVAAALIVFAVASIFEYGCILQRQDDELL